MPRGSPSPNAHPMQKRLAAYGCMDVIPLDGDLCTSEQLDYLDLLHNPINDKAKLAAVAEYQGTALLYIIETSGKTKSDPVRLAKTIRKLANRSDPAWLGVLRPGSLEIYPIGFEITDGAAPIDTILEGTTSAPLFFQSLVHGTFQKGHTSLGTDDVYLKIFNMLTKTTDVFVPEEGGMLEALEVLSMAGRALFFRFLIDRQIVRKEELSGRNGICPVVTELKDVFSSAEGAALTSAWLDATFNGDFLPLIDESIPSSDRSSRTAAYRLFYDRIEQLVGKKIFTHLKAILHGWRSSGDNFQMEFDWGDLDFAHIPVGVLSQVYERFSHRADSRTARDTSVHYTPRTIAGLMVEEAFAAVKEPALATVLDPACGAGIFLVLSFRRLVRERWLKDKKRPTTEVIQDILYNQIRGFDVSESALRLASLALYITAIELNGSPRPPHSLKFPRNIRGEVLHQFCEQTPVTQRRGFAIGSLGTEVSRFFENSFDIVVGNPPWTRLRENKLEVDIPATHLSTSALNKFFTHIGRRVLTRRGFPELAKDYYNPDNQPDLPFLWRAFEWAKVGGVVALAMPARLFGGTSETSVYAWHSILKSVAITGIINGADLRKTAVWDGIDMPFCVFFACNRIPEPSHNFHYAAPKYEPQINKKGRFRIDYDCARSVSVKRAVDQPWLLKTLSIGTWLDVELIEAISSRPTLADVWRVWNKDNSKTGKGYSLSGTPPVDVPFLAKLKDFERPKSDFVINFDKLRTFRSKYGKQTVYQSKGEDLYQSPLVIIPKAPGDRPRTPKAYLSSKPLAFSQSFYGYSTHGHPDAESLASFIYLLAHSTLFRYFSLMVSVSQGADHMIFTKRDFDALPFPDFENLSHDSKSKCCTLAHRLQHSSVKPWQELDQFVFELYGLDEDSIQLATDTLFSSVMYRRAGKAALDVPSPNNRLRFSNALCAELEPYFEVCDEQVEVREAYFRNDRWDAPWLFLSVSRKAIVNEINKQLLYDATEVANLHGCSRIVIRYPGKRGLLLGLLNQDRWWTVTRARLCAQHIILAHLSAFGLPEAP